MVSASPPSPAIIEWAPRPEPLVAVAVCAFGPVSGRLAAATVGASARNPSLATAVGDNALLVLGEADALPWVDGVAYLGDVGGVLMPCVSQPLDEVMAVRAARALGAQGQVVAVLPNHLLRIERPRPPIDISRLTEHAKRWR